MSPARLLALSLLSLFVTLGCTGKGPDAGRKGAPTPEQAPTPEIPNFDPGPREPVSVIGPVRMQVLPQFQLVDARGPTLGLHVLIRLTGQGQVVGERPPLDLAVILDRSGSMAGDKLLAVKQATLDLMKELRPIDHLTVLAYDDVVDVLADRVPADTAGIDAARKAVLEIQDRGGTALGPGMVRGLEILEAAKRGERELAHVMLLSDGQANVGEKNPDILGARAGEAFRKGISVSTLGVGLDYNEDLMTKLADQGGGRYHFIQGTEAIPKVLADEFAGLVATVAASVQLQLRPGPGIKVAKVYGYPAREENGVTTIPVGSLAAQQVREIVVKLELAVEAGPGEAALGVLALSGTDLTDNGKKVAGELALALPRSADEAAIRKSERSEVTVRVAEVESAAQLEAAAKAVDSGDYDKARQVLKDSLIQLEAQQKATPSPKLSQQIEELKGAESGLDSARQSAEQEKIYKKEFKSKAYKMAK